MKQLRYYLVLFLTVWLIITPVMSGYSGQYSKWEDRTGLSIEYKVDGADLESQHEKDTGIDVLGTLTPGTKTLTISGTFCVDDQYTYLGETIKGKNSADATITMQRTSGGTGDGGQTFTKTIHIEPPAKIPFSYSIQIPNSDLTDAGFAIGLSGNYPPGFIAHPSGIGISGSFLRSSGSSVGSSGGSTVNQPPPKSDDIWILVIGAIAVVGVVGGALVLKGRTKPPETPPTRAIKAETIHEKEKEKEKKEEKEEIQYILQISTDKLSIEPKKPGNLTVTVWKQVGTKPPQLAPEAVISLVPQAGSGVNVTPASGQGQLQVQVRTGDPVQAGEFSLTVVATAHGSTQEATVMVSIEPYYVMELY